MFGRRSQYLRVTILYQFTKNLDPIDRQNSLSISENGRNPFLFFPKCPFTSGYLSDDGDSMYPIFLFYS